MKLANKISLSISLVAICCTAAGCFGLYLLTRHIMGNQIVAQLESVAQARADHVATYLAMLKASVAQLSGRVTLRNLLTISGAGRDWPANEWEHAITHMRQAQKANPSIYEFLLLDHTGRVIVSTRTESIGADKSADTIFLGARETAQLKDVYYSEEYKEPLLAAGAPITDSRTGEFLGVLAARVKLDDLNAICAERTGLSASGDIYIVNKYSFTITPTWFRPDAALMLNVDSPNARLALMHMGRDPVAHDRTGIYPDYRGVPVLGTHAFIPEMQWGVLAEIDAAEAFAPLDRTLHWLVIILLVIPLLAWGIGLGVARLITRRLTRLHKGTEIIGAGNLDFKVGTQARDEVGQLSRAFDAMTQHLKTTTTSVDNLNKEITERRQAEDALRKSAAELFDREEDLTITLRSIGDALIATDAEGRVTRMNPVAERLTGWALTEAIGRPIQNVFRIINARTRESSQDPIARVLAGGLVVGLANHTALIARDGTEHQIADSAAPIRDAEGRLRGVVLVFHDVTNEYRIKETLQKKTDELEGFFTIALDLLCIADVEGNFIKVNKSWESTLGYPVPELERRKFLEFVHPEDMQATLDAVAQLSQGTDVLNFINRYRHKDGSYRIIEWRSSAHGNLIYAAARDITDRKQAEDHIRRAKNDWERTFDSVPDMISLIDDKHTITRVNRAMADLLGIEPKQAIGKHCYTCVHHTDAPPDFCPHVKLLKDGLEHQVEYEDERLGKWLQVTVSPVNNDQGRVIGAVHIARDITSRKQAEAALLKTKTDLEQAYQQLQESFQMESKLAVQAQAASAAKSRFVANISHEIRTPLNGIIGICELLLGTRMSADQKEYAQIINTSAETLLGIVNATLDFSKIDAGKTKLEHIDFNLRNIFENIIDLLAVNAAQKNIELNGAIEPATPLNLNGDPGRLRQVLFNLIGNAIKFTDKGEIIVRVERAESKKSEFGSHDAHDKVPGLPSVAQDSGQKGPGAEQSSDKTETREEAQPEPPPALLRFSVRDTGLGIPLEKIEHLFTAFTQVDDSFTRKFGGTGLGLAISKGLVEQMGGRIGVDSVPGQGSTFWFTVPFSQQQTKTTGSFEPDTSFGGQRILVVDDNETHRSILSLQLQAWGLVTDTAGSGQQALDTLRRADEEDQDPFWAVITDQHMPEMDGITLAQQIKTAPEFQKIPVILMTPMILSPESYAEHKDLFAGIILKPVRQSPLFYSLLAALGGEKREDIDESKDLDPEHPIVQTGLRILVVEDNPTNRKVICAILEKMGHSAIPVANGKEALQALTVEPYQLVLMDIQMPEMDGFEATTFIRNPGTPVLDHTIPIIALTAHALGGDRERCMAVGMNGYITKPVRMKAIADALANIPSFNGAVPAPQGEAIPKSALRVVFDAPGLADRLSNDSALIREVINLFLEETPKSLHELDAAIGNQQKDDAVRLAHTLKGSSANVGGQKLHAVSAQAEQACHDADWRKAKRLTPGLRRQFELLEKSMRKYLKTQHTG